MAATAAAALWCNGSHNPAAHRFLIVIHDFPAAAARAELKTSPMYHSNRMGHVTNFMGIINLGLRT